jgi:hypothetical protein
MAQPNDGEDGDSVEQPRAATVARVRTLSVFFVGVGVFAAVGFALGQAGLFAANQLTYYAVGVVVGAVGLLLWLLT